jgi:hypothetical protein
MIHQPYLHQPWRLDKCKVFYNLFIIAARAASCCQHVGLLLRAHGVGKVSHKVSSGVGRMCGAALATSHLKLLQEIARIPLSKQAWAAPL